jgi:hypothetical protein
LSHRPAGVGGLHPRQERQDAVHRLGRLGGSRLVRSGSLQRDTARAREGRPYAPDVPGITENRLIAGKSNRWWTTTRPHRTNATDRHHYRLRHASHERVDARIPKYRPKPKTRRRRRPIASSGLSAPVPEHQAELMARYTPDPTGCVHRTPPARPSQLERWGDVPRLIVAHHTAH